MPVTAGIQFIRFDTRVVRLHEKKKKKKKKKKEFSRTRKRTIIGNILQTKLTNKKTTYTHNESHFLLLHEENKPHHSRKEKAKKN